LNLIQPDGHEAFPDDSPFLNESLIREVEPVEFPIKIKNEAEEEENQEDQDIAGEFEARNHRAYKRADEGEVEKKEKRYSGEGQRQKQPMRIDLENDLFFGQKKNR